jgi:hypothetical protein
MREWFLGRYGCIKSVVTALVDSALRVFAAPQLVHSASPPVDVIVYDYLSEITMSLLARAKEKSAVCSGLVSCAGMHVHRRMVTVPTLWPYTCDRT